VYSDGVRVLERNIPAPLLEDVRGYESMFIMDNFPNGTDNPLLGEPLVYCFARQNQMGFEVSPIRSNANEQ
jgi:hypothetical protein